jgi:uncharacterized protein (DUF1684 family)
MSQLGLVVVLLLGVDSNMRSTPGPVNIETAAFRASRLKELSSPNGWLSLVGLLWLEEGESRVGSAADNGLRTPPDWPAHLGVFSRQGRVVRFQPPTGPSQKVDLSQGDASPFSVDRFTFQLIVRGDRVALRLKDPEAEARRAFHDLPAYPASEAWRVVGRLEPAPAGSTLEVQNVLGQVDPKPFPGRVAFDVGGKTYRLSPIVEDDGSWFFVFGDLTNRETTYGAGRFLTTPPATNGRVVLDFNRAENPPCAFSTFATCPIPPKGNRLDLAVEAGEKRPPGHESAPPK